VESVAFLFFLVLTAFTFLRVNRSRHRFPVGSFLDNVLDENYSRPCFDRGLRMNKPRLIGLLIAIIVSVLVLVLPTPAGLSESGQSVLAVAAFAIMMWLFQVMNNGVSSIVMMGLMIIIGVRRRLPWADFRALRTGSWYVFFSTAAP